eukprot:CAMPEP_0194095212 /NCGR_PEP_ID=MMETSP0149-20130528/56711_1 /TAXON_ID=122233 /ORGANISM="Chaetoceros debilis, Strain MM31A-1" /LENGTH=663 /DNA_ID=CAMNT_0038781151 /DNA_START=195 /DNA_END=2186 /DNA_ORIENTATION=-
MQFRLTQLTVSVAGVVALATIQSAAALNPTLSPTSCTETPTDLFFLKINARGKDEFHDCLWLRRRGGTSRENICSFDRNPLRPNSKVAKEVCGNTCFCQVYPTDPPTSEPSNIPTHLPSSVPSDLPSKSATNSPTKGPTKNPTDQPTRLPSAVPSDLPSKSATNSPTKGPTNNPTDYPTKLPSAVPSDLPSDSPSVVPTVEGSVSPTLSPTNFPSAVPSDLPSRITQKPSSYPSRLPTSEPTKIPSMTPSDLPSDTISSAPTTCTEDSTAEFFLRTNGSGKQVYQDCAWLKSRSTIHIINICTKNILPDPTGTHQIARGTCFQSCNTCDLFSDSPTDIASSAPTQSPTHLPSHKPSHAPTKLPSIVPSDLPSRITPKPSLAPTDRPTPSPSVLPSITPSDLPSLITEAPSMKPTIFLSSVPSAPPSATPTENPSYSPTATVTKCPQDGNALFYYKQHTSKNVPIVRSCDWLTGRGTVYTQDICDNYRAPHPAGLYGTAHEVCHVSCNTCDVFSPAPSAIASDKPSAAPSVSFSAAPSSEPSKTLTSVPSDLPSSEPGPATDVPTFSPSVSASDIPSLIPSGTPSYLPSHNPTDSQTQCAESQNALFFLRYKNADISRPIIRSCGWLQDRNAVLKAETCDDMTASPIPGTTRARGICKNTCGTC